MEKDVYAYEYMDTEEEQKVQEKQYGRTFKQILADAYDRADCVTGSVEQDDLDQEIEL